MESHHIITAWALPALVIGICCCAKSPLGSRGTVKSMSKMENTSLKAVYLTFPIWAVTQKSGNRVLRGRRSRPPSFGLVKPSYLDGSSICTTWARTRPEVGIVTPSGFIKRFRASSREKYIASLKKSVPMVSVTTMSTFSGNSLPTSNKVERIPKMVILLDSPLCSITALAFWATSAFISHAYTCLAPALAAIIASKPDPVPISNTILSGLAWIAAISAFS
mmetsp:Transcript_28800/g.51693  ORF Transcript_28800/g.51693 Transcript_28800/m.51693 type:complete len:221 (+) Transcript_28800:882-1544(+)